MWWQWGWKERNKDLVVSVEKKPQKWCLVAVEEKLQKWGGSRGARTYVN